MSGWFELTRNDKGHFHFVLKAGNAETILSSEAYQAKSSAESGIASVQANCSLDERYERYERKVSTNGKPFFNLKASNGQVIGSSQMYASESNRDAGITSVKANGTSKTIKELA